MQEWTAKHRRIYGKILSISTWCHSRRIQLYFLTLTTSTECGKNIELSFKILVKRINRLYGGFEYIRFKTEEGNGVLHILFWGAYLEVNLLRSWWGEIHPNSPQMRLVEIKSQRNSKNVGLYIIGAYLCHHKYIRMSYSQNIIFKGYSSYFKNLIKTYGFAKGVRKWNHFLRKGVPPAEDGFISQNHLCI